MVLDEKGTNGLGKYIRGTIMGMGDTIYSIYGRILTATACPTIGSWFGKFMRGYKSRMGVMKRKDVGITCKVVKALLERWEE